MGHLGRGGADGIGRRRIGLGMLRAHEAAIERIALHPDDDAVHHRHRFDGILAHRGFRREHHGIGAVIDGGRHIRGLGPGRGRRMHHGIQHLGRHHHRLAGEAAGADDPLLGAGHVLRRHLHAEIAARHHHRIGLLDQLIQMDQRLGLLDLHHDRGPFADQPSRLGDILRALHEGKRDPIAAEIEAELQIGAVLLGQGREAEEDIGQVQPLAVGEMAAGHHDRLGMIGGGGQHREAEAAVVEQELGAGLQRGQHLRMGQRRAGRIAQLRREIEAEALAGDEVDAAAVEPADPKLRPLQIDQHADGAAGLRLDLADRLVLAPVIVMGPMAEIEAEDIGAGLDQGAQALRRVAGGAEGGDDLRFTLSSHAAGSTRMARKSLTLVKVGPVTTRSPIPAKKL